MIKTENTSQVHELQDDELEKVSGGFDASKNEVAIETVERKQVTKMQWGAVSFDIG